LGVTRQVNGLAIVRMGICGPVGKKSGVVAHRSAHLRHVLGYLTARRFEYPVYVLDSSSGDALSQNREMIGACGASSLPREISVFSIPKSISVLNLGARFRERQAEIS
jgi:hypothetical protein